MYRAVASSCCFPVDILGGWTQSTDSVFLLKVVVEDVHVRSGRSCHQEVIDRDYDDDVAIGYSFFEKT